MPLRMLSEAIYAEVDRQIGGDGERTASGGV
jgi:hypothetical protein